MSRPLIPQARIEDIRGRYRVSDVARRLTKLSRAGNEYRGLCPVHQEKTPSFYVNDLKGFAHCFGCGFHADIIRLAQVGFRLSFPQAVDMIDGAGLPGVDPAKLAQARDDDRLGQEAAIADAKGFWDAAEPIGGTPADLYLSWRGIFVRPEACRFGRVPSWRNPETGRWNAPRPALLLRAENLNGEFVGIQRIFLTEDGGKARMDNPKLTLGRIRGAGGAVRFGRPASDIILCGSPEDGLTLFQRFNQAVTIYVTCGEANMPFVVLPRMTRSVTIARQNDRPGIDAANKTRGALRGQGRQTRDIAPEGCFKDWNDELRKIEAKAAL